MTRLLPALLLACYAPPDLPTTPYALPHLGDAGPGVCRAERDLRVTCVIDGDTFGIGDCTPDAGRFRLLGIDAPEAARPGTEAECFADAATDELRRLAEGQLLTVSYDRACTDVYGRDLVYLWLDAEEAERHIPASLLSRLPAAQGDDQAPAVLLNAYLLVAGFARRFDADWVEPLRYEHELIAAERTAALRQNGLWARCR